MFEILAGRFVFSSHMTQGYDSLVHNVAADYSLSLTCVHECEDMKDLVRIVGQSLPSKLLISLQHIHSSAVIKGEGHST